MQYALDRYQQSIREFAETGDVKMLSPTLDEYIAKLVALREVHGGLISVERWQATKGRHAAPDPVLAYKRTYAKKGPESGGVPAFYNAEFDNPVQQGEAVIRV